MDNIRLTLQILFAVLTCLAVLAGVFILIRLHWPSPLSWFIKLYTSALSNLFVTIGIASLITGLITGSLFISLMGLYVVMIFGIHLFRVTSAPRFSTGFEKAFGLHWENQINAVQKNLFLPNRRIFKLPAVRNARFWQNISFATIPGTQREILCDLWQPPESVGPSGLAFIYLHGGAWYFLDKDLGTRPFFQHLAAQGHVIMDVAYRLSPETDMMGMVHDAKRAIVWMKENGSVYGVDPERVVLGGGSSGGHLSLMAAFTADNPAFIPEELKEKDQSVCAVISLYGPSDLEAMYYHTNQHLTTREIPGKAKKEVPTKMPAWMIKKMGKEYERLGMNKGFVNAGAIAPLMGGHPDECPDAFAFYSPITHVHPHCPPTLLIHGEHDLMAPVKSTILLYKKLKENKARTIMHLIPQTDHAFDLILPKISPSAHNACYDVERFLALFVKNQHASMLNDTVLNPDKSYRSS